MSGSNNGKIRLIIRADDFGMTHSCNMAVKKCFEEHALTAAAIQAPAPWAHEAAMLAKEHPEWSIGAHLTTIGEWAGYRWRPVLPYDRVSSIVDENGFLHQTIQGVYSKKIDYDQLEREFHAQVDLLANKWGVGLSYIDTHYIGGDDPDDKGYREVVKRVADSFRLPISGEMGESYVKGVFYDNPPEKEDIYIKRIEALTPGLWLVVHHLLMDSLESRALTYSSKTDFTAGNVGDHRSAEANVLLGKRLKAVIAEKGIELVGYKDI